MAAPTRTVAQRERDLLILAEEYCRGVPQAVIARALGVSQQVVSRDLHILYRRWEERASMRIDEAKGRELAKLDNLERTYWAAFVASCVGQTEDDALPGNPAFLAGVERCIDRRAKLLGLDAPLKVDIATRMRDWAASQGLDPDEVLREAQAVISERARA